MKTDGGVFRRPSDGSREMTIQSESRRPLPAAEGSAPAAAPIMTRVGDRPVAHSADEGAASRWRPVRNPMETADA